MLNRGPGALAPNPSKEKKMSKNTDRVLIRKGARELSQQEIEKVRGAFGTQTSCTFEPPNFTDGDPGEC